MAEHSLTLYPPVLQSTSDALLTRNTKIEFWARVGSTYYPGGGAPAANGNIVDILGTETLARPVNQVGWKSLPHWLYALETAMEGASSKPTGFTVTSSISATGFVTLSYAYSGGACDVAIRLVNTTTGGYSLAGTASLLGFYNETSFYDYEESHTGYRLPSHFLTSTSNSVCGVETDDITYISTSPSQEYFTLSGVAYATGFGVGSARQSFQLSWMDADQVAALKSIHRICQLGYPLYCLWEPFDWDSPIGRDPTHIFDTPTRDSLVFSRVDPGLDYWSASLGFTLRSGG